MNAKFLYLILGILLLCLAFSACGPVTYRNQMMFGIQAAQSRMWDEAIFRWLKVLEQDPDSAAAHNNLAVAYERAGRWQDAEREYQQALALAPDNQYVQANFKNFQENLDQIEQIQRPEKKEKKDAEIK
jgi:tetratricopeptide (TPR) repeat protein